MTVMIGSAKEKDYVWFDMSESPYMRLCFWVTYVDDEWVYMKQLGADASDFKAHRRKGELRYFDGLSWELIPGSFDRVEDDGN